MLKNPATLFGGVTKLKALLAVLGIGVGVVGGGVKVGVTVRTVPAEP